MSVDTSGLDAELRERAIDLAIRLGDAFADAVQTRMPRRTGALADSIAIGTPEEGGSSVGLTVTVQAEYGQYVDEGTGVYGPEGQRIEGNPLLAFDWAAAGGMVIVHSIAGMPGTHFWSEAVGQWPSIVASVA